LSEETIVRKTKYPNTVSSLKRDLQSLGLQAGDVIIMHSAMSKIGWTVGGAVAVLEAVFQVLTPDGTLVMPTQSGDNSDPADWENPPVPEEWWQAIRDEMPPYHPAITPTRQMGIIVETFRRWPGVIRSSHPQLSFGAWGKHAEKIIDKHPLSPAMGDDSPLGRTYELDGKVLLLGVNHENSTSLHLAEWRSDFPGKTFSSNGAAVMMDGQRQWITWQDLDYDSDDFEKLGADFEKTIGYTPGKVGMAEAHLVSQRAAVDFGVEWLRKNRKAGLNHA